MPSNSAFSIFVSHSHVDNDFGIKLINDLRAELGDDTNIWYDVAGGLSGGDNWWIKIQKELASRPIFLVILSPDAMNSSWVNDEITIAWRQKNSPKGKIIIPILYRECDMREDLKTLQIISFLSSRPYETALDNLIKTLWKHGSKLLTISTSQKPTSPTKLERDKKLNERKIYQVTRSLRSTHQSAALRAALKEASQAAKMDDVEVLPTASPTDKNHPNRPIVFGNTSQE